MKTILIDIETAPSLAYVWGVWQQNIGIEQVTDIGGYIMSASYKTLGEDKISYLENRTTDDYDIVLSLISILNDADFVIAHNGFKFDIPFIKARALIHGIPPPSPFKVIDTLRIAKKEGRFQRNSLQYLAEVLGVANKKLEHSKFSGFKLWLECIKGNDEAWEEMKLYNIQDVKALEDIYLKLRPWSSNHPNTVIDTIAEKGVKACPKCGSVNLRTAGHYYTNKGKYRRYRCVDCNTWSSETTTINTKEDRQNLLVSR